MKKLLFAATAALVLTTASPAVAATRNISIYGSEFRPRTTTISAGDTVVWTNRDNANHQIVSDTGVFVSPILRPRQTFSFTFNASGTYRYRDSLFPRLRGTITVRGAPPTVTLVASQSILTYGQQATLSGVVSNKAAGESVTLYYRPYPQQSLVERATVLTTTGGVWSFVIKPQLLTEYAASWKGAFSVSHTVEVRPKVTLARTSRGFFVRVSGARSFARKTVQFQRRNAFGQWVTIRLVRLGLGSGAQIPFSAVPRGLSRLRIAMSVNQAGVGYLGAFSNELSYRRR